MNRNYADSKIFKAIAKALNIQRPYALTWKGWNEWETKVKKERPVAYFLTDTLPKILEKPAEWLIDPILEVKYYIMNRFVQKSHLIKTNLKPGQYYEVDTLIVEGLITELIDFIEIESAWMVCGFDKEAAKKYGMPIRNNWKMFRFGTWRCAEAGLDFWKFQVEHNPHHQIVIDLYKWAVARKNRPDPYEEAKRICGIEETERSILTNSGKCKDFYETWTGIEKAQIDDDTEMLCLIIKNRELLWT